jgi:general stress protein YciG
MTAQWKDELESKFGLAFVIIDRERVAEIRMMIGEGINDAGDFKIPSEIMNHLGRKGGPQGVEHGQNVNDFLGDGPAHRT